MLKNWKRLLLMVTVLAFMGCMGCELDEETAGKIDTAVDTGIKLVPLGPIIAGFWPPAAGIAAIVGIVFGAWKQRKANTTYALSRTIVSAIEKWKQERPNDWPYLEVELNKLIGPTAENIIRAMRGLPEKQK